MQVKNRTSPDFSLTSEVHQQAMAAGTSHFSTWQYNVTDALKGKSVEEIKQVLRSTAHPFSVLMERWVGDFNFGTMIRNANAFNAQKVFYLGDKKWDRRSALGTHNYTDLQWLSTVEEISTLQSQYTIVGVDNITGKSVPLTNYQFVPNTLFIFGEEGVGLTPQMQSFCQDIVEIEMYGSVRSLNCGVASGILMHQYVSWWKSTHQS
jgi:tRNA G18 (ribose-2'-O)-methylase SpoU